MNESDFENELRALSPTAPSPTLLKRIAAELPSHAIAVAAPRTLDHVPAAGTLARPAKSSALLGLLRGLLWAGAGAAVASFILLSREPQVQPAPATTASLNQAENTETTTAPEQSVSELIASTDEGLIYDQSTAEPQRQIRNTYLERHIWTNQQTGAVIEFEVPREDIVLMPVAMQ
jgi:hypothetical protein